MIHQAHPSWFRMRSLIAMLTFSTLILSACREKKDQAKFDNELRSLDLIRGDIALCGSEDGGFGTVSFSVSCSENVRANFNLATSLLHSFEYEDAEKVFAKVIDEDPECVMAYWGAAMCNFHPLWAAPNENDLKKGSKIIALGRSLIQDKSSRESDWLEAIATIYDQWDQLDHHTRLQKFEDATEKIYKKYPNDNEAAIFYALALRASADPKDKSFQKQKKAGAILNEIFLKEPNHPGIAHYIIHTFDYPELAELALPAARKYASIAAASAHAQHMPSHIFTRLGLWEESIQSNLQSVSAAQCYAQNKGLTGHWDEELHGLDYLTYAYLQQGNDEKAKAQIDYLKTIQIVFPENFKVAYSFAAMPTRYALERKDWTAASLLELSPSTFPWDKFPWEKANINFGKVLGYVHTHQLNKAITEINELQTFYEKLTAAKENRKAAFVNIQIKASAAWIKFAEGQHAEAAKLMAEAADMEDATEKEAVTPGEVIPARELLGDLYMEMNVPPKALEAYEADLVRHPNRFNGLFGAGMAAEKSGDVDKATHYYRQLLSVAGTYGGERQEVKHAKSFVEKNS